ncbi:MAG: diguanylate cyclase, partial [Solirubrobacteraceae bacterium]
VLGLRMVADVLEGAGFEVFYLGADVPSDALLSACTTHRPAILGLSVTMALNVPALISILGELQAMQERPAVFVGGQGAAAAIDAGLRVTAVEHSEDVVELVETLLGQPPAGPLVPEDLVSPMADAPTGSSAGEAGIGTIPDAFSATTLAAADAARNAARRAFEVEQVAYRDPVTGLWNRRAYEERLHKFGGGEDGFAVLMLDVDSFKAINDRYGFEAGTLGLLAVARSITDNVRAGAFVARIGGDEFAILLPDTPSSLAVAAADAIRGAVGQKVTDPPLTVSVGVTVFHGSIRATSLAAEQALNRAKRTGGNHVALQES